MPDPRLALISHDGAGMPYRLTFKLDGSGDIVYDALQPNGNSAVVGRAVTLTGNKLIRLAGAGNRVLGKLIKVESDGACTVEVGGPLGVLLPKGDGAIAVNDRIVGDTLAGARGYIRGAAAMGAAYAEAAADDQANARGIVTDVSVTTAVEVVL